MAAEAFHYVLKSHTCPSAKPASAGRRGKYPYFKPVSAGSRVLKL